MSTSFRSTHRATLLALPLLATSVACSFQASISTNARTADDEEKPADTTAAAGDAEAAPAESGDSGAAATAVAPAKANVKVTGKKIEAPGPVVFVPDAATFLAGSGTEQVLDEVRKYLEQNPRVTRLRIEGHTHNLRAEAAALELSGQRAKAVKQWLASKGVDAARLVAVGFGQTQPAASNADPAGQAQNERIAFRIAELDGKPYLGSDLLAGGTEFP